MAKKKKYTLDEVNALRVAYGNPLQKRELVSSLLMPFFIVAIFTFALFYYWWLSLTAGVVAMIYAYKIMLPQNTKRTYEVNAFRERNNFVNNITQMLTNQDRTVLDALKTVSKRANGEFKEDLLELQASLIDANPKEQQDAFQVLSDKYKDDVIFDLFVEQLATASIEGRFSMESLKDIKTYHNKVKKKQDDFMARKQKEAYNFKFILTIGLVLILAITFSFGWDQFLSVYARNPIGWITSSIYLLIISGYFLAFRNKLVDDNIMEVKV
ncbi:hypothetical protein B4102_2205 [Heyndrickxia sporothermodurans]|uniref:Type II secretion system protein GspF domain-containing protein n=1 Tax=Heyndrickxia sporothermodurans TaxID=46224 RepID=A0A150LGN4_9BACI|nr:hypothetical protein [Heyndrickxia sporothermodurans]KYD11477.1 hypothetical protein B4102_2205 [Heyndrickxia sporothermodurans]